MEISTILSHVDSGYIALPEFQRGFVWNRDQVRGLMDSLYRRHPVGTLLVWTTGSTGAQKRGDGDLPPGVVKLLLDGQQRITSLYGIARGRKPRFFEGNETVFTGLYFHLESEEFGFYQPIKMGDDPLWIDVTELMRAGNDGLGTHLAKLNEATEYASRIGTYAGRLSKVLGILNVDLHIEDVAGDDKTVDVVVEIFNRVNSGGTKLSKGDLALAKICASWPEARGRLNGLLERWESEGFSFDLDWLLRNVNTIATGEARFNHLHDLEPSQLQDGVDRAEKHIDSILNLITGRLGLDHDRVLFGRYAFPVLTHYLDHAGGRIESEVERDRLMFWYLQAAMWGRFSGSTESVIDKDLKAIESVDGGIDRLITELQLWHGGLRIQPDHFGGWSLGARFYPVLYLLTRTGRAKDWGTGLSLKHGLHGKMHQLEVHHIFPKHRLYKAGFSKSEVNAVANYCFLTKDTNLKISNKFPSRYFPKIEENHPGALESQWVPMDRELWKIENYLQFLEERKRLLAEGANRLLEQLYHGKIPAEAAPPLEIVQVEPQIPGGIEGPDEEGLIHQLNEWVVEQGLPPGQVSYELVSPESGRSMAVLDLAWPNGMQVGLSDPVAVLLNEGPELLKIVNDRGFRYFTDMSRFRTYVERHVLALVNGERIAS